MPKKYTKRGMLAAAMVAAGFGSSSAFAVGDLPVFDLANYTANAVTAGSTAWTAAMSTWIYWSLNSTGDDTVLGATQNIYNETKNINKLTQNIDNNVSKIDNNVRNIDKSITDILNYEEKNYTITKTFNDITNNYYGISDGGEIPTSLENSMEAQVENLSSYKNADTYVQSGMANEENLTDIGIAASANQKTANDALVEALSAHGKSLGKQMDGVKALAEEGVKVEGHGNQLAYANALAGAQAVQLIEMREMMLAAENARAAKVQADADTKSRQIAAAKTLREGLAGGKGTISISSDISQSPVSKGNF